MTVNGFAKDCDRNEILFRLKDIRPSNVMLLDKNESNTGESNNNDGTTTNEAKAIKATANDVTSRRILYKNKEGTVYILLVEVHNIYLKCHYNVPSLSPPSPFANIALTPPSFKKSSSIRPTLEIVLSEQDLKKLKNIAKSIKKSEDINMIIQSPEMCAFEIDGAKVTLDALANIEKLTPLMKVDDNTGNQCLSLFVTKAILRLNVNNNKIEMELLKCEAFSSERGFNGKREFLPSDKRIAL